MANALEDALKRASQNKEFQQARETLQQSGVKVASNDNKVASLAVDNTQGSSNSVEAALKRASPETGEKSQQVMQEARQNIPGDTMKEVNQPSAPNTTPSENRSNPFGLEKKTVNADTQSRVETTQQSQGNNYMYQNAVDRAQERPTQQPQKAEPQQDKER